MFESLKFWQNKQQGPKDFAAQQSDSTPNMTDGSAPALTPPQFIQVSDSKHVRSTFNRMQQSFVKNLRSHQGFTPAFQLEYGNLPQGRMYIFVAPWNDKGWLIEANGTGWMMFSAEKIVHSQTFMRSAMTMDQVTLYYRENDKNQCLRIQSSLFGPDMMTYPVYEAALFGFLQIGEF